MDTVKFDAKQVKVIAHRGLSGLERENTCPAFVAAGNRSYYGIETDVHTTRDGKFVIVHDENVNRITDGKYDVNVEQNDYSTIENIVLPDIDGSLNRQDIRIPLLTDYIKICKKYGKKCVLEIKNPFSEENIKRLIEEIKALDYIDHVIFISFCLENCIAVRKFLPDNDVQYLTACEITDDLIRTLVDNKLNIDTHFLALTKENVALLHSKGVLIDCWTCDDKETAEKLTEMGVDFITTNILE